MGRSHTRKKKLLLLGVIFSTRQQILNDISSFVSCHKKAINNFKMNLNCLKSKNDFMIKNFMIVEGAAVRMAGPGWPTPSEASIEKQAKPPNRQTFIILSWKKKRNQS